jgi:hypothetical protein
MDKSSIKILIRFNYGSTLVFWGTSRTPMGAMDTECSANGWDDYLVIYPRKDGPYRNKNK